jgi:hypothetical protein
MTSRRAKRRRDLERQAPDRVGLARVAAGGLAELLERPGAELLVGMGWTAYHRARRARVPGRLRRGVVEGAGKPRACYRLAGGYVMAHRDQPVTLVHGVVFERGCPYWHAWASLPAGAMWDPTTGVFFDEGSFREVLAALVVCEHPADAVAARVQQTGSSGPWSDCAARMDTLETLWLEELAAQHPDLARWVEQMAAADREFAATWRQITSRNDLLVIYALSRLVERPELWRNHRPGTLWPTLGELRSWLQHCVARDEGG